jgi:hypothetical protein
MEEVAADGVWVHHVVVLLIVLFQVLFGFVWRRVKV